ncbi:MAG: RNA polymerase sigma factor [Verrucomicrobia bacterium]|nr:RNA polymerase sigma factor [Verrucomicrobiota bacterium]
MADNSASWKYYFDQWGPALLLFARQQTGYLADAEDVVQDAFIKVWKKYDQKTPITKSLLFTAVRTTAIDHARSQGRRQKRENRVYEEAGGNTTLFQRTLETQERNSILEDAVWKLTKNQQEVLVLKIWGELTFDEIGKSLDISTNTAASRYRYALEHLKKQLTPSLI